MYNREAGSGGANFVNRKCHLPQTLLPLGVKIIIHHSTMNWVTQIQMWTGNCRFLKNLGAGDKIVPKAPTLTAPSTTGSSRLPEMNSLVKTAFMRIIIASLGHIFMVLFPPSFWTLGSGVPIFFLSEMPLLLPSVVRTFAWGLPKVYHTQIRLPKCALAPFKAVLLDKKLHRVLNMLTRTGKPLELQYSSTTPANSILLNILFQLVNRTSISFESVEYLIFILK